MNTNTSEPINAEPFIVSQLAFHQCANCQGVNVSHDYPQVFMVEVPESYYSDPVERRSALTMQLLTAMHDTLIKQYLERAKIAPMIDAGSCDDYSVFQRGNERTITVEIQDNLGRMDIYHVTFHGNESVRHTLVASNDQEGGQVAYMDQVINLMAKAVNRRKYSALRSAAPSTEGILPS